MESKTKLNLPDLRNLQAWVLSKIRRPPPQKIEIRMTSIETDSGVDVLMVISIDDDKN